jgi:hypothetical protein
MSGSGQNGEIKLWDMKNANHLMSNLSCFNYILHMKLLKNGKIAVISGNSSIKIFDIQDKLTNEEIITLNAELVEEIIE